MTQETLAWFAGVDWGSERHHACLLDGQGSIAGEREFPHSGAGLAELCDWLLSIAGAANTVAVGIGCSAACMSLIRGSSNYARGRAWPRN